MKNSGLTIAELTIVMVICAIVVVAIGANLVAAHYFRATTQDTIEVSREARIATNHMARVLRFAKPGTVTAGSNQITATIDGGHFKDKDGNLTIIQTDTDILYERDTTNKTLTYKQAAGSPEVIAGGGQADIDITYFNGIWYSGSSELEIKLTAEKGGRSVSVQTRILALGG